MKVPYLSEPRTMATLGFIERNKLSLRSSIDVKEKYKTLRSDDFFGFSFEVFIDFMKYEDAKEFISKENIDKITSGEEKFEEPAGIQQATQEFLDYMNFAWGKALDMRGISASRSITKLSAYLWIMNRADLSEEIERDDLYNPYGAPALISICD